MTAATTWRALGTWATIVARTSIEESNLIERFGRDYVEYMQQTGRFLPRLRR